MYLHDFENYFNNLAQTHKLINKFYPARGIAQILDGMGSNIQYKYLSLENIEISLVDNLSDNKKRVIRGIFYVMDKVNSHGNYNEMLRKRAECLEVCEDIISAMYYDSKCNLNTTINNFNLNNVELTEVPVRGDSQVGFAVMFDVEIYFDIRINAHNWKETKDNWKIKTL